MSIPAAATTDAELWRTYDDAASYNVVHSASLAADFIVACRLIVRESPTRATRAFLRFHAGLLRDRATLPYGRAVVSKADALRWLFATLASAT